MELNYFMENNVVSIEKNGFFRLRGIIHIDLDKTVPTTKKLLDRIVRIQVDDSPEEAEKFINHFFKWSEGLKLIS